MIKGFAQKMMLSVKLCVLVLLQFTCLKVQTCLVTVSVVCTWSADS